MSINLIACFSLDLKDPGAQNLGRGPMGGEGFKNGPFLQRCLTESRGPGVSWFNHEQQEIVFNQSENK